MPCIAPADVEKTLGSDVRKIEQNPLENFDFWEDTVSTIFECQEYHQGDRYRRTYSLKEKEHFPLTKGGKAKLEQIWRVLENSAYHL